MGRMTALLTTLPALCLGLTGAAADDIVHDAEYYVLEAQNGDVWAAEDTDLQARLAEL